MVVGSVHSAIMLVRIAKYAVVMAVSVWSARVGICMMKQGYVSRWWVLITVCSIIDRVMMCCVWVVSWVFSCIMIHTVNNVVS